MRHGAALSIDGCVTPNPIQSTISTLPRAKQANLPDLSRRVGPAGVSGVKAAISSQHSLASSISPHPSYSILANILYYALTQSCEPWKFLCLAKSAQDVRIGDGALRSLWASHVTGAQPPAQRSLARPERPKTHCDAALTYSPVASALHTTTSVRQTPPPKKLVAELKRPSI